MTVFGVTRCCLDQIKNLNFEIELDKTLFSFLC